MSISTRWPLSIGLLIAMCGCGGDAPAPEDNVAHGGGKGAPAASPADEPPEPATGTPETISPGLLAREFTWQKDEPPVTMIHRDDGFACLTGFRGMLAPPTEIGAVMDADGDWVLSGTTDHSTLFGWAVAVPWFVEIERPVEFKTWTVATGNLTDLVRQQDGFCVLLLVGGHFRGDTEQFRLRVVDGSWRLNVRSQTRRTHMTVMVVKVKEPGSFHGIVREHEWHNDNGQGPIRLIHSADGFAFLSGLSGSFVDGEFARVSLGDDGYWYLDGRSHDGEAHAWATSIQLTGTDTPLIATTDTAADSRSTAAEQNVDLNAIPFPANASFSGARPLSELNEAGVVLTAPSVSADGLTIWWTRQEQGVGAAIRQATRAALDEPFGGVTTVLDHAKLSAVSPDGLEIVCLFDLDGDGRATEICTGVRSRAEEPFSTPRAIPSLASFDEPKKAAFSSDGLSLLIQVWKTGGAPPVTIWISRRRAPRAAWGTPQRVTIRGQPFPGAWQTSPSFDGSEQHLLLNYVEPRQQHLSWGAVADRTSDELIWDNARPLLLDGERLLTFGTQYCAATGELFFVKPIGPNPYREMQLWVARAQDANTPPSAAPPTIYGEWEIVEATEDGAADEDLVGDVYEFSDDGKKLAIHFDGNRSSVSTFHLDCTIDPTQHHVDYALGADTMLGIYNIEDSRLTICFDVNDRPTDFTSTADNEHRLLVLKRVGAPDPEPVEMPRPEVAANSMTPAQARAALEKTGFEFTEEDGLKAVFAGGELTDDALAPFQYLPEITGIALIEAPVTDAGLKYLTGLENLTDLDLEYARITDEGVRQIGQMSRLQGLGIRFCENVTADGLKHLSPLTHLKFLLIDGVDIGPGQLQFAREMAELEMFNFDSSLGLADSDLRILGGMTKLTSLDLHAEPWVNDNTISHLSNLKALEELDLSWNDISDSAMQTVAGFPRLQGLSLLETGVGDEGMEHLSQLTELHAIDLSYTEVTPRGLAALRDCPLTDLTFRGPPVTDRHLVSLRQWKDLTALNLQGDYYYEADKDEPTFVPTQITLRGIRTLSEFDQLEELWLTINPQITDAAVPYLSKLKNLQVLDLAGTGITSEGGRAIAEAIDGLEYENLGIE